MQRACVQCHQSFAVFERDQIYYQQLGVPTPTKCPQCRFQLRLSFRNERFLYQRNCQLCHQPTLSQYATDKPYTIYCRQCWWSDQWDPLDFGQVIDWNRSFFEQFAEVKLQVPRLGLLNDADSENSDFCNRVNKLKNCYMIFDAVANESCIYGSGMYGNKDSVDCDYCDRVELCYDCSYCTDSYGLRYSRDSVNCRDSALLVDCVGVSNSLMCVGLRNVQYCYKNKQLTQAEFQTVWNNSNFDKIEFEQFALTIPRRYYQGVHNDDSSGDHLVNTHAVLNSFQVRDSENCGYCYGVHHAKDSYDYTIWGEQAELMYEDHACGGQCSKIWFGNVVWYGHDTLYCDHCLNGAINCFGCVGLKNQQNCILNKQYSPDEYQQLSQRLIEQMRLTGEYGHFFPASLSDFCYNETMAQEFFPLTKQQALASGWQWQDHLPGSYGQADLAKQIYTCAACTKNFRLIAPELKFYQQQGIPLPIRCPDCRHAERMKYRSPYQLYNRQCMKPGCPNHFQTAYGPDRPEIIYCEDCYQKEMY
ncbi:MAG: zinc-ribbon domain containing protein [Candidatus Kerfeldbacteria bacterium]|nr:zinc-ribbon domain containing protein [Candidatus Kerfeldbacteria bacterium]